MQNTKVKTQNGAGAVPTEMRRATLAIGRPHPGPLPEGEGEYADRPYHGALAEDEGVAAAVELARKAREAGRTVVFANGCFDLLHCGHLATLEFAASLGDVLIVAVNSDESARRLKGDGRPATGAALRAGAIAALECVDYVTLFDDDTPAELIGAIRPDVLVKGAEYQGTAVPGSEFAGRVEFAPMIAGVSTTEILNQIAWESSIREEAGKR